MRNLQKTLALLATIKHPLDVGNVSGVLTSANVSPKDRYDLCQLAAAMSGFVGTRGIASSLVQQSSRLAKLTNQRGLKLASTYPMVLAALLGYDEAKYSKAEQPESGRGPFGMGGGGRLKSTYRPGSFYLGTRIAAPLVSVSGIVYEDEDEDEDAPDADQRRVYRK